MRTRIMVILLLLVPPAALADAMATAITVFDAHTFAAMTATNAIRNVPDGDLFAKSLVRGCYFGGKQGNDVAADFACDNKKYRLFISRSEAKTVYAVLLLRDQLSPQVVAVGEIQAIPSRKEIKDDPKGDPFVVVVRSGNYLLH